MIWRASIWRASFDSDGQMRIIETSGNLLFNLPSMSLNFPHLFLYHFCERLLLELFPLAMLEVKSRALYILGKYSTTELYPQSLVFE